MEKRYRELRDRYFGADAYDFGEHTLLRLASRLPDHRIEDRLAILMLNREFYPNGWHTFLVLGDAYLAGEQPEISRVFYECFLEIHPTESALRGLRRVRDTS